MTLTNEGTNAALSMVTGDDGIYKFTPVKIGTYKLTANDTYASVKSAPFNPASVDGGIGAPVQVASAMAGAPAVRPRHSRDGERSAFRRRAQRWRTHSRFR